MNRIIRRSPPKPEPAPAPIVYTPDEEERGGSSRTDHVAIIKKYAAKVTNRASAIRAKCVECSGGALSEVRDCPITKCALWPYRQGDDPNNKKTKARMEREAAAATNESQNED